MAATTRITAYDVRHIQSDAADKADANWTGRGGLLGRREPGRGARRPHQRHGLRRAGARRGRHRWRLVGNRHGDARRARQHPRDGDRAAGRNALGRGDRVGDRRRLLQARAGCGDGHHRRHPRRPGYGGAAAGRGRGAAQRERPGGRAARPPQLPPLGLPRRGDLLRHGRGRRRRHGRLRPGHDDRRRLHGAGPMPRSSRSAASPGGSSIRRGPTRTGSASR